MPPNQNCFCYWGRDCVTLICVIELRTLNTQSICSPQCVCSRAELSLFFSSDLHYWPLVSEREGEGGMERERERGRRGGNYRGCYSQNEAVSQSSRVCKPLLSGQPTDTKTLGKRLDRLPHKHSHRQLTDEPGNDYWRPSKNYNVTYEDNDVRVHADARQHKLFCVSARRKQRQRRVRRQTLFVLLYETFTCELCTTSLVKIVFLMCHFQPDIRHVSV